jgi:hypothetical protein
MNKRYSSRIYTLRLAARGASSRTASYLVGVSRKAKKMTKMYHEIMRNVISGNELRQGGWRNLRLGKSVSGSCRARTEWHGRRPATTGGGASKTCIPTGTVGTRALVACALHVQGYLHSECADYFGQPERESGLAVIRGDESREQAMEKGVRCAMNHEKRMVNLMNHEAGDATEWGREEVCCHRHPHRSRWVVTSRQLTRLTAPAARCLTHPTKEK